MKRPSGPNSKETDVRFLEGTELKICETRILKFLHQGVKGCDDTVVSAKDRTVAELWTFIQKRKDELGIGLESDED